MRKIALPLATCFVGIFFGILIAQRTDVNTLEIKKRPVTSTKNGKQNKRETLKDNLQVHNKEVLFARQNTVKTIKGRHFTLITGRVVRNGVAYPNCQLFLSDMNPVPYGLNKKHTATIFDKSDRQGRFLFAVSNGGRYLLGVTKHLGPSPFKFKLALNVKNTKNSVRDLGDLDVTLGGSIYGQVTDSNGQGLPSITVIARIDKKTVLRTLTGSDGTYRLGFIERKKDIEVLFVPRPPFKKHFKPASVLVKTYDSPVIDQVLEVKEPKSFGQYVFVYSKIDRPEDPEFGHGPSIEVFRDGKHLFTQELGDQEGLYYTYSELELGRYLICIKQGNSLRIGKYIEITGDEFTSFELTEYDVIPTRKLVIELDLVQKKAIPERENYLKVGFPRPRRPGVNNPYPRFLMSLAGGYNEIEVPMNMPLILKHNSISVDLENSAIGPNQSGLLIVKGSD